MANDSQQQAMEFEKGRQQLIAISSQKQQFQLQSSALNEAVSELDKTLEKKVFKAVGNILIQSDTDKVKKELKEKKESIDLRIKSLQKQEELMVSKLNKIKSQFQNAMQSGDSSTVLETEKSRAQKPKKSE